MLKSTTVGKVRKSKGKTKELIFQSVIMGRRQFMTPKVCTLGPLA